MTENLRPEEKSIVKNITNCFLLKKLNYSSTKYQIVSEINGERNKTPSVEKYLNKIRPCLREINNQYYK